MTSTLNVFFLLSVFLVSQPSFADKYFDNLRQDQSIPERCHETSMEFFEKTPAVFTVGIEDSSDAGFDHEVAISRDGAEALWHKILRKDRGDDFDRAVRAEPRLMGYYDKMLSEGEHVGFDFKSEGDILEFLYLMDLKEKDTSGQYYYTSGVAYHTANDHNYIGELDIVVGMKDTCQIVAIGEAKLGTGSIGKARSQLQRFRNFLRNYVSSLFFIW